MQENRKGPLLRLENITVRVRDKHILQNTNWTIHKDDNWAVLGPNGSGKTSLVQSLIDEYTIVSGSVVKGPELKNHQAIGYVSFEQQQALKDHSAVKQQKNEAFTAIEILGIRQEEHIKPEIRKILKTVGIDRLLYEDISHLSTGETRRVLIGRALCKKPRLLILDEPFEGLDPGGRKMFENLIDGIINNHSTSIILVTHRLEHLPQGISHILVVNDNSVTIQGRISETNLEDLSKRIYGSKKAFSTPEKRVFVEKPEAAAEEIISMNRVNVKFSAKEIIRDFTWSVKKGENWVITGANGTGKSTILRLIYGDISQAYGNEISLFGRKKGSGESLWEIRKQIGYLSTELHMDYRINVPAVDVVLSGLFDSVGLYRRPTLNEQEKAEQWLSAAGLSGRAAGPFDHFSFGEQRLILLARGLMKAPPLLLLDEPLQGMDPQNRARFLNIIADAAAGCSTQAVMVSHHDDEIPGCFHKHLHLQNISGFFSYKITAL